MTMEALPGEDLVLRGVADLRSGIVSIPSMLVAGARSRLEAQGIVVARSSVADPEAALYELVVAEVGVAAAHGRYNALRRRVVSYLDAVDASAARR